MITLAWVFLESKLAQFGDMGLTKDDGPASLAKAIEALDGYIPGWKTMGNTSLEDFLYHMNLDFDGIAQSWVFTRNKESNESNAYENLLNNTNFDRIMSTTQSSITHMYDNNAGIEHK